MKKNLVRLLSVILAICLCLGSIVFAEELPDMENEDVISSEETGALEQSGEELAEGATDVADGATSGGEEQPEQLADIPQADPSANEQEGTTDSVEENNETDLTTPVAEPQSSLEEPQTSQEETAISVEEQPVPAAEPQDQADEPQTPVTTEITITEVVEQIISEELPEEILEEEVQEETEEQLEELNVADNTPLSLGMNSEAVKNFQKALQNKGYDVWPDGYYGPLTEMIVKVFQMYNGFPVTGIADETVQNAASGNGVGFYMFGRGTNSKAVSAVQTLLRDLGYLYAAIDGDFGSYTEEAVVAYQKKNGLTSDGTIGMETLKSILTNPVAASGSYGLSNKELSKGDKGDYVKSLQNRLDQLGFLRSNVDGDYGTYTEKAVKQFQMYNNLPITGAANTATIIKLNSENAVAFYSLSSGKNGDAAKGLQSMLKDLGYPVGNPDGDFGPVTKKALTLFQQTNGLYPDGIAGPITVDKLFQNPLPYDPSVQLPYSEVELLAMEVLDRVGWNLYSAFEWSAGMSYNINLDIGYTTSESAIYSFRNYYGNCISMASTFYWMAKLMGYSVRVIYGQVPYSRGGYGVHAWVEIDTNGGTYVCDPDYEMQMGRNGYMIYYGQSGTWKYVYGYILSDY